MLVQWQLTYLRGPGQAARGNEARLWRWSYDSSRCGTPSIACGKPFRGNARRTPARQRSAGRTSRSLGSAPRGHFGWVMHYGEISVSLFALASLLVLGSLGPVRLADIGPRGNPRGTQTATPDTSLRLSLNLVAEEASLVLPAVTRFRRRHYATGAQSRRLPSQSTTRSPSICQPTSALNGSQYPACRR